MLLREGEATTLCRLDGHFTFTPEASRPRNVAAGGSGITPVFSIPKTLLETDPASTVTLVHGKRRVRDIVFSERR